MATSSENSDQVLVEDERRLKRKLSNRESARRSRKRKQALLHDLTAEIGRLKTMNAQIMSAVNATSQNFLSVDGQNSVLRAQVSELSQRLESLNSIASQVSGNGTAMIMNQSSGSFWNDPVNSNQWNNSPMYGNVSSNQIQQVPIVASAAMFP